VVAVKLFQSDEYFSTVRRSTFFPSLVVMVELDVRVLPSSVAVRRLGEWRSRCSFFDGQEYTSSLLAQAYNMWVLKPALVSAL
jgi:hypothetical protein